MMELYRYEAQNIRSKFTNDPHRPVYHYLPPRYWLNDPNGLIQVDGTYHMCYQHNPHGAYHNHIHWGHATSTDLIHWTDQPLALVPSDSGPDQGGCWSGCAIAHEGQIYLFYTGVSGEASPTEQRVCVAISRDGLVWEKPDRNPLIDAPPPEFELNAFRDPSVWRENSNWYMIIGAGINDVGGTALLYWSDDLMTWHYLKPILIGDVNNREPVWTGAAWECPQLLQYDDEALLVVGAWDHETLHTAYMAGTYQDQQFTPTQHQRLDYGNNYFYAPQTLTDSEGRRVMFGWIQEGRDQQAQIAAGWSGVMSLPRIVALEKGQVNISPAPELQQLRGENHYIEMVTLHNERRLHPTVSGRQLELKLEVDVEQANIFRFIVCSSPDGEEQTSIFYDRVRGVIGIDRSKSSLNPDVEKHTNEGSFELESGERLCLHVFVDHSVIEVYVNNRTTITSRVYPARPDSLFVAGEAEGQALVIKLEAWALQSIW